MSQFSRHEALLRLLQDTAVSFEIVTPDRPPQARVDVGRAILSAIGLASLGQPIVSAIRDLHVPCARVTGAEPGAYALAVIASLYSLSSAAYEPILLLDGRLTGPSTAGVPVVLLAADVTSGKGELEAFAALRRAGLRPTGCVAVLDREQGGSAAILEECPFSCLVTLKELLQ